MSVGTEEMGAVRVNMAHLDEELGDAVDFATLPGVGLVTAGSIMARYNIISRFERLTPFGFTSLDHLCRAPAIRRQRMGDVDGRAPRLTRRRELVTV
ncbi:hypothetical protein [Nocardia australiensis]|uniref:hypothetical protein n=1 Tax=Nocardia australiensis TaxID=2887191 RepID=UPI001D156B3D|nr:hypothetical protein [Nocardia australiensis]